MKISKKIVAILFLVVLVTSVLAGYSLGAILLSPQERYEDAEVWVDLDLLPGVRINLWSTQDIEISEDQPSHVSHGFVTDIMWIDMTPEEQTEFLTTAEFRFFHKGNEISLRNIIRLDENDGRMYSMFYRVFPPGYFPVGSHQLSGEWNILVDGELQTHEKSGSIKIVKEGPLVMLWSIGPSLMQLKGSVRLRNFGNLPDSTEIMAGHYFDESMLYSEIDYEWSAGLITDFWVTCDPFGRLEVIVEDASVEYLLGSVAPSNALFINIVSQEISEARADVVELFLDGYYLGSFSGDPGINCWRVSNYDFSQGFMLSGKLISNGVFEQLEAFKIEFFFGYE